MDKMLLLLIIVMVGCFLALFDKDVRDDGFTLGLVSLTFMGTILGVLIRIIVLAI